MPQRLNAHRESLNQVTEQGADNPEGITDMMING